MRTLLVCLIISLPFAGWSQKVTPLINAHAHNDYEHKRPLLDALENGFVSVEADVHLVSGKLYVSHDHPRNLSESGILEQLYLDPLLRHIRKNKGEVYRDYKGFFYLMIDVKTSAESTYPVLRSVLSRYEEIISVVRDSIEEAHKPVKVFISGHHGRPIRQLLNDPVKYAGLDGRPQELGKAIPAAFMPVISENYGKFLSWDGSGEPDPSELYRLNSMIKVAHREGRKVRLWAAPDRPEIWELLLKMEVDLINTDKLPELKMFLLSR